MDETTAEPIPPAITGRFVPGEDVQLWVEERGPADRPTIVLVHGYPDTSGVWAPIAEVLADRFHVVTYDVRGAGRSGAPLTTGAYDIDVLVRDLDAVIVAVSPDRPIHLVGHDWGSIQSWAAVLRPGAASRIASFTSISGPATAHVDQWLAERRRPSPRALGQLLRQLSRSWYVAGFQVPGSETVISRAIERNFPQYAQRREGVETDAGWPAPTIAADARHGLQLYRANFAVGRRTPDEAPAEDVRTNVPVQVVVPIGDPFVTPALLDGIERLAPRLWRRDVPGRHWIVRRRPDHVARWVSELVDHVEGGPESRSLKRARIGDRRDRLFGAVAVVTGAGSGIGRAAAVAMAERGAIVVAADVDGASAERTVELCAAAGGDGEAYTVDVGDPSAMEQFAKHIAERYEAADILVNNAGIGIAGPMLDTETADWERVLHVNLWGVINGSRLFARQMVERGLGGHIVNVASAAAFAPSAILPAYSTTKAAVLMLSECLRVELAPEGIGVSAICPGIVDTNIVAATTWVGATAEQARERRDLAARLYQRRNFGPDRVAAAILHAIEHDLAVVAVSPEARAIELLGRYAPGVARRLARGSVPGAGT